MIDSYNAIKNGGFNLRNPERFMRNWERVRQRGKTRYVLIHSFVMGAAPVIGSILGRITNGYGIPSPTDSYYPYFIDKLWISFTVTFVFSVFGSMTRWDINEDNYGELINKDETH